MNILVTGAAGFIGFHLAKKLLSQGHKVTGIDNLSSYYDVKLKQDRLNKLSGLEQAHNFRFFKTDLANEKDLADVFAQNNFSHVVNLAAQAGVRHSLEHTGAYFSSNLMGFGNLLEQCRRSGLEHLVFASSSSVYGLNNQLPFGTDQNVDHPVSLYAATKKSNELMAHAYSHLYNMPATGLRFFTVYGPWGRPDMALHLFTSAILRGEPVRLFNNGQLKRDFTYVDDIVEGVIRILDKPASPNPVFDPHFPDPASSSAPWRIYNIGNNNAIPLASFVDAIEEATGKKAKREYLPMQPGDVEATWANVDPLYDFAGFRPATDLREGVAAYVKWHREYYGDR